MIYHNHSYVFECQCGVIAEANVASDYKCIRCNGNNNYFIICPNCGTKIEVKKEKIPSYILPYIKIEICGFGFHD